MTIVATDARLLTLAELDALITFAEFDSLSWWDDFDTQGILDVYHACGDWDGVNAWCSNENPEWQSAQRVYRKILARCKRRMSRVQSHLAKGVSRES